MKTGLQPLTLVVSLTLAACSSSSTPAESDDAGVDASVAEAGRDSSTAPDSGCVAAGGKCDGNAFVCCSKRCSVDSAVGTTTCN